MEWWYYGHCVHGTKPRLCCTTNFFVVYHECTTMRMDGMTTVRMIILHGCRIVYYAKPSSCKNKYTTTRIIMIVLRGRCYVYSTKPSSWKHGCKTTRILPPMLWPTLLWMLWTMPLLILLLMRLPMLLLMLLLIERNLNRPLLQASTIKSSVTTWMFLCLFAQNCFLGTRRRHDDGYEVDNTTRISLGWFVQDRLVTTRIKITIRGYLCVSLPTVSW